MNKTRFTVIALSAAILGTMALSPRSSARASAYTDGQKAGSDKGKQAAQDDQPKDEAGGECSSSSGCCG